MAETDGPARVGPGATLADGRYRLEQRLGAGGMATVWLAQDERLQRPVAVKVIADTLAGDEAWLRRFSREARAAAALSHRGVVPVFDYGVQDGRPYLVMEYIAGGNLAQRLDPEAATRARRPGRRTRAIPPPAPPDPVQLARELLEALAGVHAAGILHRDVKPANLLIDAAGHVRLTDFGIAQPQDATSLTRTGMVVGTLRYIAPEVAAGGPASVASDLYSAGRVIAEVAGDPPPQALRPLVAALTAPEPSARPRNAAAALALLPAGETAATAVSPQPVAAPVPGLPTASTMAAAPTAATRVAPGPARPGQWQRSGGAGGGRVPGRSLPPALLAALGGLIVLIFVVVLIAGSGSSGSGGSGSSPRATTPAPAPAGASISRQVSALEQIVRSAQQR